MKTNRLLFVEFMGALVLIFAVASAAAPQLPSPVERGKYLATTMGCGDCHTPMTSGPAGPQPDFKRLLSGHPEKLVMPAPPKMGQGPWAGAFSSTFTAWAGPWGVSFSANLTPDKDTGLGGWTAQNFSDTLRTGRVLGMGRNLLPPMPVGDFRIVSDDDLRALYAYLQSIPPLVNHVPAPVPPIDGGQGPSR